jgi:septal ring factor EnvC (AmiA/AmiB activator)
LKAFEQDVQQLTEEKDLIERQLRQTQIERNEFQQENAILTREW